MFDFHIGIGLICGRCCFGLLAIIRKLVNYLGLFCWKFIRFGFLTSNDCVSSAREFVCAGRISFELDEELRLDNHLTSTTCRLCPAKLVGDKYEESMVTISLSTFGITSFRVGALFSICCVASTTDWIDYYYYFFHRINQYLNDNILLTEK